MRIEKSFNLEQDKEVFIGETDEEILNCEGGPCNFIYKV